MLKKLDTPFKIWLEDPKQRELFISIYAPHFLSKTSSAYFWYGDILTHQNDDRGVFNNHKNPEIKFSDLLTEPHYEIY